MIMVRRGEIYLADLGAGVGSEQKGERPVVIVQNNKGNKYSPTVSVVPITTKIHKSAGMSTHVLLGKSAGLDMESACMAEQVMTIDKKRLIARIGKLPENVMSRDIAKALNIQLDLKVGKKRNGKD